MQSEDKLKNRNVVTTSSLCLFRASITAERGSYLAGVLVNKMLGNRSSTPRTHIKKLGVVAHAVMPAGKRQKQADPQGSLATQPSRYGEL